MEIRVFFIGDFGSLICIADPVWQLESGGGDPYPERPGEPDCKFFVRTGSCGFGARCRYNHPRDRRAVIPSIFSVTNCLGLDCRCFFFLDGRKCRCLEVFDLEMHSIYLLNCCKDWILRSF